MNKYLTKLARLAEQLTGKLSPIMKNQVRRQLGQKESMSAMQKKYHKGLSRAARFDATEAESPAAAGMHRANAIVNRIKSK